MINVKDVEKIVSNNENFFKKELNDNITIYSYRVCDRDMFNSSLTTELRGLTFVNDECFLSMKKFFNVNEIEENQFGKLVKKDIDYVAEKLDGSFIHFIKVNNKWIHKTKNSIDCEQIKLVSTFLKDNSHYYDFVEECYNNGLYPLFEIISPKNRIVLKYNKTDLVLTAVRNKNGEYLNLNNIELLKEYDNISKVKYINVKDLNEVKQLIDTLEGIEGFVIKFKDGHIVKFKTEEYFRLHILYDAICNSNKEVLRLIINNDIDDAISTVEDKDILEEIEQKRKIYNKKYNELYSYLNNIVENFNGDFKEYALKYKEDKYMNLIMSSLRKGIDFALEQYFLSFTKKEKFAIKFFEEV